MLVLFLLIYDGEFLILIPYAFNTQLLSLEILVAIVFFFIWLLIALIFDYALGALEWQI